MRRNNILLVDDDRDIQELVGFFLRQAGFVVKTAPDGFSALMELQSNCFDLMILDISLPHVNGHKVVKSLRAAPKFMSFPVIMLTASHDPDDRDRVQDKVSDYIIKPPDRDDLLKRIERILGGRPQYEEVKFDDNDPSAMGAFTVPLRMLSMSRHGIVLLGSVPVERNFPIQVSQIGLFQDLKIQQTHFKVMDCSAKADGTYEYFIPFLGMNSADHETIHRWLLDKVFEKKKIAA